MLALLQPHACSGDRVAYEQPAPELCDSERRWIAEDEPHPWMLPGSDCMAAGCHGSGATMPFAFAGTIYANRREADDCFGQADAVVIVEDADHVEYVVETNAAGNFFIQAGARYPFRAAVSYNKRTVEMLDVRPEHGSCNGCHTATGLNGAPGRIHVGLE